MTGAKQPTPKEGHNLETHASCRTTDAGRMPCGGHCLTPCRRAGAHGRREDLHRADSGLLDQHERPSGGLEVQNGRGQSRHGATHPRPSRRPQFDGSAQDLRGRAALEPHPVRGHGAGSALCSRSEGPAKYDRPGQVDEGQRHDAHRPLLGAGGSGLPRQDRPQHNRTDHRRRGELRRRSVRSVGPVAGRRIRNETICGRIRSHREASRSCALHRRLLLSLRYGVAQASSLNDHGPRCGSRSDRGAGMGGHRERDKAGGD